MKTRPIDRFALTLAQMGPVGLAPVAPGTVASAVAVLAAPWIFLPFSLPARVLILLALLPVGAWAAGRAETVLKRKDPGSVVLDELLGQWLVLLPIFSFPGPETFFPGPRLAGISVWLLALAFALFRLFDIAKPGPVRKAELLPGGWGVMLDDAVAGLLGLITLLAAFYAILLLPGIFPSATFRAIMPV